MRSFTKAAATFVMSLVLVVICLGLWVDSRGQGVGTELDQVTLATSGVAGGLGQSPPPPRAASATSAPADSTFPEVPVVDATRIEIAAEVQPPRKVTIGSVDIAMPIRATGVTRDGQMELPADPKLIGWYRFGALPGDSRGSAVLGGHVDSDRYGTGPLARLSSVRAGEPITVIAAGGERMRYRVTSVERITKAALPVDTLFDPESAHRLVIVTCGGRFLPDAGGYEDNIVVIAEPVS